MFLGVYGRMRGYSRWNDGGDGGKISFGRLFAADAEQVVQWRKENSASIKGTAKRFGLSEATVRRYCAKM